MERTEEYFKNSYLSDLNDGKDVLRYYAIMGNEGMFTSSFKADNGLVALAITSEDNNCFVTVLYADEVNYRKYQASVDDL